MKSSVMWGQASAGVWTKMEMNVLGQWRGDCLIVQVCKKPKKGKKMTRRCHYLET